MKIASSFTVPAAPDRTFETLLDLERVGPCFPGAEVGARAEDGSYPATVAVRLGPMRMLYEGTVRIAEQDPGARSAVLQAQANESRGQGSAEARMTMRVGEADSGGSSVAVETDLALSGRAQQVGKGMVQDVAERLVGEMAKSLAALVAEPAPAGSEDPQPAAAVKGQNQIHGLRLFFGVLWARIRRLGRRLAGLFGGSRRR